MAVLATLDGTFDAKTGVHSLKDGSVCRYDAVAGQLVSADGPPLEDPFQVDPVTLTQEQEGAIALVKRLAQSMLDTMDATKSNSSRDVAKQKLHEAVFWTIHSIGSKAP